MCVTVNHSVGDAPAIYSIDRLFETLVGVALACGVDILLPYRTPPAPEEGPAAETDRPPEDTPRREGVDFEPLLWRLGQRMEEEPCRN